MNYRVGDIVYCKRNFYPSLAHRLLRAHKVFQKGCYYEIIARYDSDILHKFIFRLMKHPIKPTDRTEYFAMENHMKIFGTLKDERREKLKKLKK